MKIIILYILIFNFFCISPGFAGTFIDDFSDPTETKATWEVNGLMIGCEELRGTKQSNHDD